MTNAEQVATAPADVADAEPAGAGKRTGVHLPGDPSMWVFVLGDFVIFSVYFVIFMITRHREPGLFLASQHELSPTIAVVNTLVLLASSRFVALAVQTARKGDYARATKLLYYTAGCGVLFILIKAFEWHLEISHHHTLGSNNFFMFYYMLTGIHVFHVLFGIVALGVVVWELRRPGPRAVWAAETGATYWHMVDLLWLVIFAIVYVMR